MIQLYLSIYKSWKQSFCVCVKVFVINDRHMASLACTHFDTLSRSPRAVDEAVGIGSHLHKLARLINDVALNFADSHFWEPLFIYY